MAVPGCCGPGLRAMPIASPRYPFNIPTLAGAPADAGVFALFEHDELIYIGSVNGRGATIQSRLRELQRAADLCTSRATHYAWEISIYPRVREAALLGEYQQRFHRLPRCNAKSA